MATPDTPTIAVVTIVTRSHLAFAVVLQQSCLQYLPEAKFFCILIDYCDDANELVPQSFNLVDAKQVFNEASWQPLFFQYSPFELCCALKPFAMFFLLKMGFQHLIYLDSDIALHSKPISLLESLALHPIVLTPHAAYPHDEVLERFYLNSGVFNAGAVACRNCDTGYSFLSWWAERLRNGCCDEIASGLFVDQKWLDLVPCMFPETRILRNPGFNAGHWTLKANKMKGGLGSVSIGDSALEAFHYSYFTTPEACDLFYAECNCDDETYKVLKELVIDYSNQLKSANSQRFSSQPYLFSKLPSGEKIKRSWQYAYRTSKSLQDLFPHPFDPSKSKLLVEELERLDRKRRYSGFVQKIKGFKSSILKTIAGH